jgi:hypothetical protein
VRPEHPAGELPANDQAEVEEAELCFVEALLLFVPGEAESEVDLFQGGDVLGHDAY